MQQNIQMNNDDQDTFNIPNFSLLQKIDVYQYCENTKTVQSFLVSTNYDGSVIVAAIKQQVNDHTKLINFIFEKQSYVLERDQIINDAYNYIINMKLNREGNILVIEYHLRHYDFYYKWYRNSKWVKFKPQSLTFYDPNMQFNNNNPYFISSTSNDLSVFSLKKHFLPVVDTGLLVKSFSHQNKNYKLLQNFQILANVQSIICKEKNFIIVENGNRIDFYTLTTQKQFQQLQIVEKPKDIQLSSDTKLYILLKGSLQVFERKNNANYTNILILNLNADLIERFSICKDKIFFHSTLMRQLKGKVFSRSIHIFQTKNDKLLEIESRTFNLILKYNKNPNTVIFPNDNGFIIQCEITIQFFQSG